MECLEVASVAKTQNLWERFYEDMGLYPIVQEAVWLISQCVVWMLIFYVFHRCKQFLQVGQREARQKELVRAYQLHSDTELRAVDKFWPCKVSHESAGPTAPISHSDQVHPMQLSIPKRARTKQPHGALVPGHGAQVANGGAGMAAEEASVHLVSVVMCTLELCTCAETVKESASGISAPGDDNAAVIKCVQVGKGHVVQTQVKLKADTGSQLTAIAGRHSCEVAVQLGRWRACCLIDGEVKTLKLGETDPVPVILHASHASGILTVEGLHLTHATIQVTLKDKCIILKTKSSEGASGLEAHTCACELPSKNLAAMSVLAIKQSVVAGHELRVSSLAVQIQDNNLRSVLRDILPFTVLAMYAVKQVLSILMDFMTMMNAFPMVAWLTPLTLIIATQVLPKSTESTIRVHLNKLSVRTYLTLYFAIRSFIHENDPDSLSTKTAEIPELKPSDLGRPSNRPKPTFSILNKLKNIHELQAEEFLAIDGSGSVLSSEWQWPVYDTIYERQTSYLKLREKKTDDNAQLMVPFVVVYHNHQGFPWANQVQVNISSPILKEVMKELMPSTADRWGCKKIVAIDGPELFRMGKKLRDRRDAAAAEPSSSDDTTGPIKEELQHLTHLVRFMDQELEEIEPMYAAMKREKRVTWQMLWAFFPPGERLVYLDKITDENLLGEVVWAKYQESPQQGVVLVIKVVKWDYNCKNWSEYSNEVLVPAFDGDRKITSLDAHPVQFKDKPESITNTFLENGKKFCELSMLASSYFMNYKGSLMKWITVDNCRRLVKENADGRVMIDLGSFSKMNPDYPLGSAQPPCEVIRENKVTTIDITDCESRKFAPSLVYGFSFRLKQWGSFSVCGFSPIVFNPSAYDALVMNPATKELTESLVREHLHEGRNNEPQDADRVDPIANKGEGCIFLCYGPPGTGKTLTAESLSEKLQCPLWCLSVSELGLTPAALESMLVKVMDVAASWGAILLLDEADVYLERRSSSDLTRNAMTGVFLRRLEYYRGVLFLTTNRVSAFDEAFCSRIAMFLYYGRHNHHQRSTIWTTLFNRVGLKGVPREVLDEFSKPEFNGREIRNIMQTAQTLARSKKENLSVEHIRLALTVYKESSLLRNSLIQPYAENQASEGGIPLTALTPSTSMEVSRDAPLSPSTSCVVSRDGSLSPSNSFMPI